MTYVYTHKMIITIKKMNVPMTQNFPHDFEAQKFLLFMNPNLPMFSFMVHAFGVVTKKSLPNSKLQGLFFWFLVFFTFTF